MTRNIKRNIKRNINIRKLSKYCKWRKLCKRIEYLNSTAQLRKIKFFDANKNSFLRLKIAQRTTLFSRSTEYKWKERMKERLASARIKFSQEALRSNVFTHISLLLIASSQRTEIDLNISMSDNSRKELKTLMMKRVKSIESSWTLSTEQQLQKNINDLFHSQQNHLHHWKEEHRLCSVHWMHWQSTHR